MIPFGNHIYHIKSHNQSKAKPLRAVSAERVSLRDSFFHFFPGSMTVEASLVLPIFIFFMAEILSIFDMIRLQSRFLQALHETGMQLSEYAFYTRYAVNDLSDSFSTAAEGNQSEEESNTLKASLSSLSGSGDSKGEDLSAWGISFALSETYVRDSIQNYLGTGYLDHTCLEGGHSSISYLQSNIMEGNDYIDLVADYRVKPFLPMFGLQGFSSSSRYYGHAWTGYDIEDGNGHTKDSGEAEETVYITRTGSVYHRNRSCTYLKPSIRSVPASELSNLRSSDGSKYYACEVCHPSRSGQVIIAEYGNRYHCDSSCSAIHRDIIEVPLSQVKDTMRPCSKCGGG